MSPIVIQVGIQGNGVTFQLTPWTEVKLSSQLARNLPPSSVFLAFENSVFLGLERTWSLEQLHGPAWSQVVMLLTGLDEAQIQDLGGFQFVDCFEKEVLFESLATLPEEARRG